MSEPLTCEDVGCPCGEALDEEDLSDTAMTLPPPLEPPPDLRTGAAKFEDALPSVDFAEERGAILQENAAIRATLIGTSLLGDTYSEETGEVLKDAPGWADGQIQNVDGLDWAGGKLAEVSAVIQENERLRDAAVARLQRQIDLLKARTMAINSPLVVRQEFFETAIRMYADAHRTEVLRGQRKGAKSRTFPSGLRLAWKSGGGEYRWRQDMSKADREAALLKWGKDCERMRSDWRDYSPIVLGREYVSKESALLYVAEAKKLEGLDVGAPPGLEYVPEHEELIVKVEE